MKLTEKQKFILGLLVAWFEENQRPIVCKEFIKIHVNALKSQGIDTSKINSTNATLASLATKELVEKGKEVYQDNLFVSYKPTQKGLDFIKNLQNKVEEKTE